MNTEKNQNSVAFSVDATELHEALKKAVSKKGTLTATEYALIVATEGSISIVTTDTKVQHSIDIEADVDQAGTVCLEVSRLKTALEGPTINARIFTEGNLTHLKSGRRNYRIPSIAADAFPSDQSKVAEQVDVDSLDLLEAIERVQYCAPVDNAHKFLNSVRVQPGKTIASTGISISMCSVSYAGEGFNIPTHSIKPVIGMLKAGCKIFFGRQGQTLNRIKMQSETETLIVRLDEVTYPEGLDKITAHDSEWQVKFNPESLLGAIRRMTAFAGEYGGTKHKGVILEASDSTLRVVALEGRNPSPEKGCEEIQAEITGEAKPVCMSAGFLYEAINALKNSAAEWHGNSRYLAQKFCAPNRDDQHFLSPMKI